MNKLPIYISIIAIVIAIFSVVSTKNASEQVYVDVNKLLEGYKKTAVVRAEFQKKAAAMKSNVDTLLVQWKEELKTYEKERANMTKKELRLKQELLSNKQEQLRNYQEAVQKQLKEEDEKNTQTVINDINSYVTEYGKKHNFRIIFGASGSGNIMYAEEGADLTAEVLEGMNADYQGN